MVATAISLDIDFDPMPTLYAHSMYELALDIRSYREPLKRAIQGVLSPSFRHSFDTGGRPPWEPLSESTIERKTAKGVAQPDKILVETGALRRVVSQLNIWTINGPAGEAFVSTLPGTEYGEFHLDGTEHMPARPFLEITPADEEEIVEVFDRWILERFARHGWLA